MKHKFRTALFFKNQPQQQDDKGSSSSNTAKITAYVDDGLPEELDPQLVVRALYQRYQKQLQRWADYRNLFLFLSFCALFLGVLYAQRSAQVAYKVYNTIESLVVPETKTMQSTDDVYSWLQGLLQTVWKDPICGDGICETPFEFASYGRFGCRADCGMLSQVQNLTTIQVDLYYDFSHPLGSVASSDLMDQASWNLCPQQTPFSGDCYFDTDQQFDSITGEQHVTIDDAPGGSWDLLVKRDIFDKVRGAVRDVSKLRQAGFYQKVALSALAAAAERDFEISLLQSAINITSTPLLNYMWVDWQALGAGKDAFDMQQLGNATCMCTNGTEALAATAGFTTSAAYLASSNCSGVAELYYRQYNSGTNSTDVLQATGQGLTDLCASLVGTLARGRANMTGAVQRALVDRRLGDIRLTGKISQRNSVMASLQRFLQAERPELLPVVFSSLLGTDPLGDPGSCRVDTLAQLYVDGPTYSLTPAPAYLDLSRRKVYDPAISFATLASRAQARITEVRGQAAEAAAIVVPAPLGNTTLANILSAFTAAGASRTFLPQQTAPALAPLNFTYDLATWQGNTTAYMQCALDARGAQFIGTCVAQNVTCAVTANDTTPYNCTDVASGSAIAGNISVVAYREDCELPCDMQQDCSAVCECYDTCGGGEVCTCDACMAFSDDAKSDTEFVSIASSASSSGASAAIIADLSSGNRRRRRLQQSSAELQSNLTQVLGQLSDVKSQQVSLGGQMTALQGQVDKANQLAVARAGDTKVLDLVQASRDAIASGQAAMVSQLDALLQKQQAALEAASTAAKALAAIQDLQSQQTKALQSLEKAVQNQLYAIKVATSQNVITIGQALLLWKRARRDRALATKVTLLANIPCSSAPTVAQSFKLDNGNIEVLGTARERSIGLSNRVVGGMLVTTWRSKAGSCSSSKFASIQGSCTGAPSLAPYGVDPVFKRGTSSYNPDLDDADGTIVTQYYNCSEIAQPLYNLTDPYTNLTSNTPLHCAQLYNPRALPWAFHHLPMAQRVDGFPVWFDINLSADDAQTWFTWVSEGLYLDEHTSGMSAEMVTYNAELRVFGAMRVTFDFQPSGSIQASYSLYTLRVELYSLPADQARLAFEVLLTLAVFVQLLVQLGQMIMTWHETGSALAYFASGWSWLELASNGLLAVCISLWWIFVEQLTKKYQVALRYDVYAGLHPEARYLSLSDGGAGLASAVEDFNDLDRIIAALNWYYALNGINILLLIARCLKRLDFQPRLGVVTRSLARAGPDLLHFAVVFAMVFMGYSLMGHLIFGSSIDAFQDLATSVNTCFEMLLGNIDVNNELRALGGLQGAAGTLFFWSYMLLVFMVLLNFLLAIIVDAFSEVKGDTAEKVGLHTELARLAAAKWRALVGRLGRGHISDRRLGLLLRSWAGEGAGAGEGEEREGGAGGEGGEKTVKLLGHDLDEAAIRDVLLACLDDGSMTQDDSSSKLGALVNKLMPGRPQRMQLACDAEVEAAARMLVQRLAGAQQGVEAEGEEEDDDKAPGPSRDARSAMEAEREALALALERLAEVQRELAEGQRALMASQRQLQDQQGRMLGAMAAAPPSPNGGQ